MALSLTCVCGARFELDDTLAGQNVTCPECQQALKAPTLQHAPRRTSGLALASVILALMGASTVIGSALGSFLGMLALARIARQRDRLAGVGLALFGIIAGMAFTALTLLAASSGELFGLGARWRESMLADQVDTTGDLELKNPERGFTITRPSRKWGVAHHAEIDDAMVRALLKHNADLLLVQTARYLFVDVRQEWVNKGDLREFEQSVLSDFEPDQFNGGFPFRPKEQHDVLQPTNLIRKASRDLDAGDNVKARELELEVTCGQKWYLLVRLYRTAEGRLYVVRAFAQGARRYRAARPEFEQILDSFRILKNR